MANSIQVLTFIANDMLRQTKNNLQFLKNVGGQEHAHLFTSAPKKGSSISFRKSTRYTGRSGETFTAEDYTERTVSMSVGTTLGVDLQFTNRELMLSLDQISERVVKPAAETLASLLDTTYLAEAVNAVASQVGTPGTVPTALKTYNQARARMSWFSCPNGGHTELITPDMQVEAVDAGKSFFNPTGAIKSQYETGMIGEHAGAKVYEVQNLPTRTNGQRGGTPLMAGSTLTGATQLVTDGWSASVAVRVKKGDIFTLGTLGTSNAVMAVNPWTRASTGFLKQFTAAADASSDVGGNLTVLITEPIVSSGPFQNVSQLPPDNAPLNFEGAASVVHPVGLRFHRDAFMFATLDQPMPSSKEFCKVVSDPQTGLKIRYIRDWNTSSNVQLDRFDVVPAWGIAFPEFACRIAS